MVSRTRPKKAKLQFATGFSWLPWTFTAPSQISCLKGSAPFLLLASGPYLYGHEPYDESRFCLQYRLCVFEATGTVIRGVASLFNDSLVAWGDSYIAHFSFAQLLEGGTVCQQNIISTGRQIAAIQSNNNGLFAELEVVYTDGTVQEIVFTKKQRNLVSVIPSKTLCLPLRPTETITTSHIKTLTILGTSHGRLLGIKNMALHFVSKPIIHSPVKQITCVKLSNMEKFQIILLFENGSIVFWNGENVLGEIKGRYTCISLDTFTIDGSTVILAGDRDGHVTQIQINKSSLAIHQVIRNVTINAITIIEQTSDLNIIIGADMGEMIYIHLWEMSERRETSIPEPVKNSRHHHKITDGWYFLKDDKLCNWSTIGNSTLTEITSPSFHHKGLKLASYCSTGRQDREITIAYVKNIFEVNVTDYSTKRRIKSNQRYCLKNPILRVFLMHSFIVFQNTKDHAEMVYIDSKDDCKVVSSRINSIYTFGYKITAVACIPKEGKKPDISKDLPDFDLMIAYDNGIIEFEEIVWNKDCTNVEYPLVRILLQIPLQGSFIVSMMANAQHVGLSKCILLSRKGMLFLVKDCRINTAGPRQNPFYVTIGQLDLRPIIGKGHSLLETSLGLLAIGFKQNTLHVCLFALEGGNQPQYWHILSVETTSYRLPFTVMEIMKRNRKGGRQSRNQLVVSYHYNNSIHEKYAPFKSAPGRIGLMHTGIILNCITKVCEKNQIRICSGDTTGRLRVWGVAPSTLNGQILIVEYKLNGAITGIEETEKYVVVATSQGDLYFFSKQQNTPFQLAPIVPLNMKKKINFIMCIPDATGDIILIFLGDGSIQEMKLNGNDRYERTVKDATKLRAFGELPVPIKMALYILSPYSNCYYIISMGIDGILRRSLVSIEGNVTCEMNWNWNISIIKRYTHMIYDLYLVGDPHGWLFLYGSILRKFYFHIDRYHKQEIIDTIIHIQDGLLFICSLDIGGTAVIRRMSRAGHASGNVLPI